MPTAHEADERPTAGQDDDVPGRLALAVGRLNRRIRSSTGGLSHGQLSALSTIVRRGPLRPSELAAIEVAAAPTITRVVAELEARGLVERTPDPEDRRSLFVSGTDAGTELLLEARSDRARAAAGILADLTPEQLDAVRRALPALEQAAQVTPPPPAPTS
ncbi:MarR family winged helix-turn-helix transcriptional regulator [Leifsonia virtsii]|uniref:MarR family transcriptional regulator n=1 Tax=Leifsonia virtsii TaxID=3035915 RepID=A0ABT8IW77_9MICO|nr:MarR family transcriptional regulator [Leifsonia virtsii]MDN4597083.1 MarR family transcriptional regulator [Leifsonia virtsii]